MTKLDYGMFSLEIKMMGKSDFWDELIEIHDTHGLPWDLMYKKLTEATNHVPDEWTSGNFEEFMNLYRYERKTHPARIAA